MFKIYIPGNFPGFHAAAELFQQMTAAVTGVSPDIVSSDDGITSLVTFGSDAENLAAHQLIQAGVMPPFRLRCGSDAYQIVSCRCGERTILFLAGGNLRSLFYAVYDYFEKVVGCHYFWDGDVIPRREELPIDGIDIAESPRFQYRGLRYFAHRGLKRFQAEQWDFEDWKQEFDWVLKKRLNFGMLRIGLDDLYQKAFPDVVPYPELDAHLPESIRRSYDDHDQFWSLRYRGELRRKVLEYGRSRGLLQIEDCGTMTHWYSRTPQAFLDHFKPDFLPQISGVYSEDSGRIWDISREENLDRYFQLTETSIREHGEPDLFHTIGLGERHCFADRDKNQNLKHYAYHRIIGKLRRKYPHVPLLIAGWDFFFSWKPEEVRALLEELDPGNTLLFDYTADKNSSYNTFLDWGVVNRFPWIFGIFQCYEAHNELHARYHIIEERLRRAAEDPMCRGLAYWPENSHQDTLMLDYFPAMAWDPSDCRIEEFLPGFCRRRYPPESVEMMHALWRDLVPLIGTGIFGNEDPREDRIWDVYPSLAFRLSHPGSAWIYGEWDLKMLDFFRTLLNRVEPHWDTAVGILERMSRIDFSARNAFIRRDLLDMARTIHIRTMDGIFARLALQFEAWRNRSATASEVEMLISVMRKYQHSLSLLLEASPEFSLNESLRELRRSHPVNPNFEMTLKGNVENDYCRSFIYELSVMLYEPGTAIFADLLRKAMASGDRRPWIGRTGKIRELMQPLQDRFYDTPLEQVRADNAGATARMPETLAEMAELLRQASPRRQEVFS